MANVSQTTRWIWDDWYKDYYYEKDGWLHYQNGRVYPVRGSNSYEVPRSRTDSAQGATYPGPHAASTATAASYAPHTSQALPVNPQSSPTTYAPSASDSRSTSAPYSQYQHPASGSQPSALQPQPVAQEHAQYTYSAGYQSQKSIAYSTPRTVPHPLQGNDINRQRDDRNERDRVEKNPRRDNSPPRDTKRDATGYRR